MSASAWTLGIYRSGLPAPAGALAVVLGYWAVFLLALLAFGWLGDLALGGGPPWSVDLLWDNVVSALLCAYFSVTTVYGLRGTERDLDALRPLVRGGEERFRALRERVLSFDDARRRVGGGILIVLAFFLQLLFTVVSDSTDVATWSNNRLIQLVRIPLVGWFAYRAVYFDVSIMRAFVRLGRDEVRVPLFDAPALAPFSRHGLRAALLWFVGCVLFSLFTIGKTSGPLDLIWLGVLVTFATVNLVVPVWGVHQRLRVQKREELAEVRRAIVAERDAAGTGKARVVAERLAPLLALEARLEQVREWPFDAFTLLRFFLYAAIGVGSWLGGALVERGLGVLLD